AQTHAIPEDAQVGVPLEHLWCREDLLDGPPPAGGLCLVMAGERLAHRLRAFGQKRPPLGAARAGGQPRHVLHPVGTRVGHVGFGCIHVEYLIGIGRRTARRDRTALRDGLNSAGDGVHLGFRPLGTGGPWARRSRPAYLENCWRDSPPAGSKPAALAASTELNQNSGWVCSYQVEPGTWYFLDWLPLMT